MSDKIDELSNDEISVYQNKDGRLRVYIKDTKKVISYPRYIVEQHLNRELLPTEQVHHKDGDFLNNDISNLEVLDESEHFSLHAKQNEKYHDKMMTCPQCGKEFLWTAKQQLRFNSNSKRYGDKRPVAPFCSKSCSGKYGRMMQQRLHDNCSTRRKLTDDDVLYIREHYIPYDKNFGQHALGRMFNVGSSTIDSIIRGTTYKNVVAS